MALKSAFFSISSVSRCSASELRPLLEVLQTKGITYHWKFPFSLLASSQGCTALLRVLEDLQHFCDTLGILHTEVPEWYAEYRTPLPHQTSPRPEPTETQDVRYRRHRSPSEARAQHPEPHPLSDDSTTKPPHSSRARRDH